MHPRWEGLRRKERIQVREMWMQKRLGMHLKIGKHDNGLCETCRNFLLMECNRYVEQKARLFCINSPGHKDSHNEEPAYQSLNSDYNFAFRDKQTPNCNLIAARERQQCAARYLVCRKSLRKRRSHFVLLNQGLLSLIEVVLTLPLT